jgi:hypothetical protein
MAKRSRLRATDFSPVLGVLFFFPVSGIRFPVFPMPPGSAFY